MRGCPDRVMPPGDLSSLLADSDDARVAKTGEQHAVANSDAAASAERNLGLERPQRLSCRRIERENLSRRRDDEHLAAAHEKRRFGDLPIGQFDRPRTAKPRYIRRRDLIECRYRVAPQSPPGAGHSARILRRRLSGVDGRDHRDADDDQGQDVSHAYALCPPKGGHYRCDLQPLEIPLSAELH